MATKSKIHIKPSKRGSLRKAMGAKKGEKLSVSEMKKKMKSASPTMKKKLNFAINARKWKHEDGGMLPMLEWGGDPTSLANLGTSFAEMNNLSQPNELVGTNNPGGRSKKGLGLSFDPISLGLSALTAIGGSIGANMATQRNEMYEDAAENMRQVDINKATKNSGIQAFLENPLSLGIGGKKRAKLEAEEFNENIAKQQFNKNVTSRFSTMSQAPTYAPVARQGGFIAYKGQTHEGPDGGILVDKFGNPTAVSQEESVASVEGGGKNKKGEVSYYDPESGSTYIYSDSLKFAKPANGLLNKYKLNKPDSLQYLQYKNDPLTKEMVKKKFENLTAAQEFAKQTDTSSDDAIGIFRKGGQLSQAKAKEMLRDGTVHGKKLTPKQRGYFGWIAGGRKEEGGELPIYEEGKDNIPYYLRRPDDNSYYFNDKTKRMVYPGNLGSISPGNFTDSNFIEPVQKSQATRETGLYKKIVDPLYAIFNSEYQYPTPAERERVKNILASNKSDIGQATPYGAVTGPTFTGVEAQQKSGVIDIPKAPVFRRPIESSTKGVGKLGIVRQSLSPVDTGNINLNAIDYYKEPYSIRGGLQKAPQKQVAPIGEASSNPWLNPAGHLLSGFGALADYNALRKAKPENVSLGRVGAERISLAKQRLANTRNTASAKAMASSAARSSGMNAGVALSNALAANTGANRLLGQQNAQLLEQEENTNAQMQQQANMINAELAAQEGMFNTQTNNAYKMMLANRNPIGNLARTAASYFADNAAYQQGYDTLQMLAPNAELYRDPNAKWKKNPFARPKVRLRDKTL